MQLNDEEIKKVVRSKFQRHAVSLTWKCYLQRQRRWRLLLAETLFAAVLLVIAVLIAKPVFLTPLQTELEPPLASVDLFASLHSRNVLGYAPNEEQCVTVMSRAAQLLQTGQPRFHASVSAHARAPGAARNVRHTALSYAGTPAARVGGAIPGRSRNYLQTKAWIACLWTILFTFLNTFLAEMLVHHEYDQKHIALTFILHLVLPPLGLVHALNEFAMLQTGRGSSLDSKPSLFYTILSWSAMNLLYFAILMIMQKTVRDRALGGAVSLKSIIFKKMEDTNKLRPIKTPNGHERAMLQEVDELVAKAICFRNCSKSILNVPILSNITMDIYRGEFTILFAERIQDRMIHTIEDLLTGLTSPDEGTITVLGHAVTSDRSFMSMPYMMGYCHDLKILIDDLTVEEHLTLFTEICLWYESTQYWEEFLQMRRRRIYSECELEVVRHTQVVYLGAYYRAQLCWALALLMEPRVSCPAIMT